MSSVRTGNRYMSRVVKGERSTTDTSFVNYMVQSGLYRFTR